MKHETGSRARRKSFDEKMQVAFRKWDGRARIRDLKRKSAKFGHEKSRKEEYGGLD